MDGYEREMVVDRGSVKIGTKSQKGNPAITVIQTQSLRVIGQTREWEPLASFCFSLFLIALLVVLLAPPPETSAAKNRSIWRKDDASSEQQSTTTPITPVLILVRDSGSIPDHKSPPIQFTEYLTPLTVRSKHRPSFNRERTVRSSESMATTHSSSTSSSHFQPHSRSHATPTISPSSCLLGASFKIRKAHPTPKPALI
jgi:hypothetical protein